MPRFARVVVPGCPHHITHRGNRRDDVFFTEDDRAEYLDILLDYTRQYGVEIWGYCLMTTHVHLVGVPEHEESLGLAIGRAHMKYARHANRRQRWWGHLWANRFYSTPMDDAHCWTALKYCECNPLRAGLVTLPWEYAGKYQVAVHGYLAENIPVNAQVVKDIEGLAYYFVVFHDRQRKKMLAVRRASQFKGVMKARLITLLDDSLRLVPDDVVKLDTLFDYLVTDQHVLILHPTGFEYTAGIEETLSTRAVQFTGEIATNITCVDFSSIAEYVATHKRAARLVASIRSRNDLHLTSPTRLTNHCSRNGIQVMAANGKIWPQPGFELQFLEVLDRRRYVVELIEDTEELYVAPNRRAAKPPTA